jgi:hypothetical protein
MKFHVLLCKGALNCHKLSKEGEETLAASYQTVRRRVNAVKNGREETDDAPRIAAPPSAMDDRHVEQLESALESTRGISRTIAAEVRISPASVYLILTKSLEEK